MAFHESWKGASCACTLSAMLVVSTHRSLALRGLAPWQICLHDVICYATSIQGPSEGMQSMRGKDPQAELVNIPRRFQEYS